MRYKITKNQAEASSKTSSAVVICLLFVVVYLWFTSTVIENGISIFYFNSYTYKNDITYKECENVQCLMLNSYSIYLKRYLDLTFHTYSFLFINWRILTLFLLIIVQLPNGHFFVLTFVKEQIIVLFSLSKKVSYNWTFFGLKVS